MSELFGLHPLAVEDAVHAHQRPKVERYDERPVHVSRRSVTSTIGGAEMVRTGEIMVFCGPTSWSPCGTASTATSARCARLEEDPGRLALGPAAVLHAIADRVVDEYICVGDAVQQDIDEVEERVFSAEATKEAERIYRLKRELIELKRAVDRWPAPLRNLAARRFVPAEIREYFRDVDDHLTRVPEQVESLRRTAHSDPPGPPDPGHRHRKRGHAQDPGVGRDLAVPTVMPACTA